MNLLKAWWQEWKGPQVWTVVGTTFAFSILAASLEMFSVVPEFDPDVRTFTNTLAGWIPMIASAITLVILLRIANGGGRTHWGSLAFLSVVAISVSLQLTRIISGYLSRFEFAPAIAIIVIVAPILWVTGIRLTTVIPRIILENAPFWSALESGWKETRSSFWQLAGIQLLAGIIGVIVALTSNVFGTLLQFALSSLYETYRPAPDALNAASQHADTILLALGIGWNTIATTAGVLFLLVAWRELPKAEFGSHGPTLRPSDAQEDMDVGGSTQSGTGNYSPRQFYSNRILVKLLAIAIVVMVILILLDANPYRPVYWPRLSTPLSQALQLIGIAYFGLLVGWLLRVWSNIHFLRETKPRLHVSIAVFGFFIPVVNFVAPYPLLCHAWRESRSSTMGAASSIPAVFHIWGGAIVMLFGTLFFSQFLFNWSIPFAISFYSSLLLIVGLSFAMTTIALAKHQSTSFHILQPAVAK